MELWGFNKHPTFSNISGGNPALLAKTLSLATAVYGGLYYRSKMLEGRDAGVPEQEMNELDAQPVLT